MFTIKPKYKNKVVGFNGSATPLGERNDLIELADIAVRSQDPTLLYLFTKLPTQEDVMQEKEREFFTENKKDGNASS